MSRHTKIIERHSSGRVVYSVAPQDTLKIELGEKEWIFDPFYRALPIKVYGPATYLVRDQGGYQALKKVA